MSYNLILQLFKNNIITQDFYENKLTNILRPNFSILQQTSFLFLLSILQKAQMTKRLSHLTIFLREEAQMTDRSSHLSIFLLEETQITKQSKGKIYSYNSTAHNSS